VCRPAYKRRGTAGAGDGYSGATDIHVTCFSDADGGPTHVYVDAVADGYAHSGAYGDAYTDADPDAPLDDRGDASG
jgi:hypothetical protein